MASDGPIVSEEKCIKCVDDEVLPIQRGDLNKGVRY